MAEKTYNQEFIKYISQDNISSFPKDSGVYAVYSCTYNSEAKKYYFKKLIYIGKADDLNDRISGHEKWDIWKKELGTNGKILFSYTLVDKYNNERVEATLINSNKPKLNTEYKDSFPFDTTTVICSGKCWSIEEINTAIKTN